MNRNLTLLAVITTLGSAANAQLVVTNDSVFNTSEQMFLANELFRSGEPYAEQLGYNLDSLDAFVPDMPDSVAYTTGIESYENSHYVLGTLEQGSGLGAHMVWAPDVMMRAAMEPMNFDGSFTGGTPNGFEEDDELAKMLAHFGLLANDTIPVNGYPQFADFESGNTHLPQTVAADYASDRASLRWNRTQMTKTLDLDAMGQSLDKLYLWARDMLGNFHDTADTKVPPDGVLSPDSASGSFDPTSGLYYGGSRGDGFDGQLYTAEAISKTLYLTRHLAYNGTALGALDPATYDPMNGILYFPHRVQVTETVVDPSMPHQPTVLTVMDANSHLFDQLSYLGAVVGFHNMMDPNNTGSDHRAYHNVFDGDPFAGPLTMTGVPGPFDLMSGTSRALFLNIMAMHYNTVAGTFVDVASLNGNNVVQGTDISAINAGMALTVLAKFSGEFAAIALGTSADSALTAQANYIIAHLKDPSGGYYNSFSLGTGPSTAAKTLDAQAAIVRGLYEAFLATNTTAYLNEANAGYNNMIDAFYAPGQHVFRTVAGNDLAVYTPMDLALLTGALRDARLAGLQMEADNIYARVFKTVYKRMMLTEAEETGETGGDSDGDGIPYIVGGTRPFAFVAEGQFAISPLGMQGSLPNPVVASVYPDPATTSITLDLQLPNSKELGMTLYDLQGHFVGSVLPASYGAGEQKVIIPTESYPIGTYYIRTVQGNSIVSINRFEVSR